jgi:hypothetical protein
MPRATFRPFAFLSEMVTGTSPVFFSATVNAPLLFPPSSNRPPGLTVRSDFNVLQDENKKASTPARKYLSHVRLLLKLCL